MELSAFWLWRAPCSPIACRPALNEPEASLHPDLMEPLAKLIVKAAERTQLWLVTHSTRLVDAVIATGTGKVRKVIKQNGATQIEGLKGWGEFEEDE